MATNHKNQAIKNMELGKNNAELQVPLTVMEEQDKKALEESQRREEKLL